MNVPQVLDSSRIGLMVPVNEEDSPLPLEQTTVVALVTGPLDVVAVTQRFSNPLLAAVELEYLFPLPASAAIVDFELRIGSRTIQGDVQEVEQARAGYEAALSEGKRAGLLEQRRPNLFAVRLGNVKPGDTLLATMRYQERLVYDDGCYSFVFPMGITPRYHSPEHPAEGQGVDAPLALGGERIGPVEITLSVDAGAACGEPSSPSHKIELTRLDEQRFIVRLGEPSVPDHDFVLRYPVAGEQATLAAWRSKGKEADYFLATVVPPSSADTGLEPAPREFIFVLDRSGSMSGGPIGQARNALRACLRTLNPRDQFWLLLFDDMLEWFRQTPCPVSQATIEEADGYLSQVEGRGGTEIIEALEAALARPQDETRTRYLVFLTDGAVSAEERVLDQVRRKIGKARLFTFGIGPSVNRALLTRLAQLGRGAAEFLQLDEDIEGAILRFQDRVLFPVLTDLSLQWENAKTWDVYPAILPDLFAGQPLEFAGRIKAETGADVRLKVGGQAGKDRIELKLVFPKEANADPVIAHAWGRARIDDLLEGGATEKKTPDQVRTEVIGLALEQRLVTPYTAFVAIDHEQAIKDGQPLRSLRVAQPLPAGLDLQGFVGSPLPPGMARPGAHSISAPQAAMLSAAPTSGALPEIALPKFLRKSRKGELHQDAPMKRLDLGSVPPAESLPIQTGKDEVLRWLARSQELNGSWQGDCELTSVALMAFLRAGYSTRVGYFRQQIRRAVVWLLQAKPAGTEAWTRVFALAELAQVEREPGWVQRAQEARVGLPPPATWIESALSAHLNAPGKELPSLTAIHSLDELRLAALLYLELPVPDGLLKSDLGRVYAVCISIAR